MRSKLLLAMLAVLLLPLVGPRPADVHAGPKVKLDKKKIQDLATRWIKARPKTHFERWDRKVRQALLDEAKAMGEPPEGALDDIVELMWKPIKKHGPRFKKNEIDTPYGRAWWLRSGKGGKKNGLILGLHGGGAGAGDASEAAGKWKLPKTMQMYPQGVVLVGDTWNSVHGERFLLTLIEIGKVQYEVDPDRVYAMGFSMGGTGSFFMAGRHPDLLAGAIPAHGIVPAKDVKQQSPDDVGPLEHGLVPNLRNLAVYFYTGLIDKNCDPGTFRKAFQQIEELRKDDRGGYGQIEFMCHPGIAHSFPSGEPGKGYKWIEDKRRNAFPETIVWEYNANPHPYPTGQDEDKATRRIKRWMYWLHCQMPEDYMMVRAVRSQTDKEHVIDLEITKAYPDDFSVYLNDRMADPKKEVVLRVGEKEVYRGKPKRGYDVILESLDAKLDRTLVFDRKIKVPEED